MIKQLLSYKKVCQVRAMMEMSIVVLLALMIFSCSDSGGDSSGISIDTDNVLTSEVYASDSTKIERFSVRLTQLEQKDSVSYALDSSATIEVTDLSELKMSDLPMEDGKKYFIEIVPDVVPAPTDGESKELADYGEVYWAGNVDKHDLEVILGNFIFLKEKGSLRGAIQIETVGSTWVGIDGTDAFFPIDSSGYYLIENIPQGEYKLVIFDIDPDSGSDIERLYSLTVIVDDEDTVVVDPIIIEPVLNFSPVSSEVHESSSVPVAMSSSSAVSSSSEMISSLSENTSSARAVLSFEISSSSVTLSSSTIETYDAILASRQKIDSADVHGLWFWIDESTYEDGNQSHRTDTLSFFDNGYVYVSQWENDAVIKMANGIWRVDEDKISIELRECQELKTGSLVDVSCDGYNTFYTELFVSLGRLYQRTSKDQLRRFRSVTWGQEHLIQ